MELGITGGEEDGVNNEDANPEDLYSKPEDALTKNLAEGQRVIRSIVTSGHGFQEHFVLDLFFGSGLHALSKPKLVLEELRCGSIFWELNNIIFSLWFFCQEIFQVYDALSKVENGFFTIAAAFGNVHGVYQPGNVKLEPTILDKAWLAHTSS